MGDTAGGVRWALEKPCALRTGKDWKLPSVARKNLASLYSLEVAMQERMVFDDLRLVGKTFGPERNGQQYFLPAEVVRLHPDANQERLAEARSLCAACDAMCSVNKSEIVGACYGFVAMWGTDGMQSFLEKQNQQKRIKELFPPTNPWWFGFWIDSPLTPEQCSLLASLFEGCFDPTNKYDRDGLMFLRALQRAATHALPLHVEVVPPGHIDLGFVSVFPHCARCKAPPSKNKRSGCAVCGSKEPPSSGSDERFDFKPEGAVELTLDEYETLSLRFLRSQGCSEELARDVFDESQGGPLRRRSLALRQQQEELARKPYPPLAEATHTVSIPGAASIDLRRADAASRPFYVATACITKEQFAAVMQAPTNTELDRVPDEPWMGEWFSAVEFCLKLSEQQGRCYRLLQDSEWEFAEQNKLFTVPVYGKKPTPMGEWCNDNGEEYRKVGLFSPETTRIVRGSPSRLFSSYRVTLPVFNKTVSFRIACDALPCPA